MWTPQYFVRYLDFPATVEGVTVPNDDGTFDIYISRNLSDARRRECLEHELRHINLDHFYSPRPVPALESEARSPSPPVAPQLDIPAAIPVGIPLDVPHPSSIPHFPSLSHLRSLLLSQK